MAWAAASFSSVLEDGKMSNHQGNTNALLLAGGLGTRLKPLTDTTPKCLIPIGGRPLLDFWIRNLVNAGVSKAVINTHHLPEGVREAISRYNEAGTLILEESFEPKLLGSAGTVTNNRGLAEDAEDILLIYADNLSSVQLKDFLAFHRQQGAPMSMLLFRADYPKACGIAGMDDTCTITSFVEKPENPATNLANAGVYAVTATAYREIADLGAFDLGFEVLPKFVSRMQGYALNGYHRDIGTLDSLSQAEKDFASGRFVPESGTRAAGTTSGARAQGPVE
jgi:mannose-1-phosphate guanylyltransferase